MGGRYAACGRTATAIFSTSESTARFQVSSFAFEGKLRAMTFEDLPGLTVRVDSVAYDPTRPAPPDRPHPFVYHISIHNDSPETVSIFGRKWIVRDTEGQTMVVEGDGVVGQFPKLSPGETFSYNSYHVVKTESTASGSFFGTTSHGRPVCTRIPAFDMHPPMYV
jgi:ApaG protein